MTDCTDMKNGIMNISQSNHGGKLNLGGNKYQGNCSNIFSGDVHQSTTDYLQYALLPESHQCAEPVINPTWRLELHFLHLQSQFLCLITGLRHLRERKNRRK